MDAFLYSYFNVGLFLVEEMLKILLKLIFAVFILMQILPHALAYKHTQTDALLLRSECMLGVWISLSCLTHASAVSSSVTGK